MSVWDTLGNIADWLRRKPDYKPSPEAGQRVASQAYIPDVAQQQQATTYNPGWRGQFGLMSDIAKNMPTNPGGWNDSVETLRLGGMRIVGNSLGELSDQTLGRVDRATGGTITKLLMAGPKNVRSNYAFVRGIQDNSAAMGLLSGLTLIAGGVAAGAAAAAAPVALGVAGIAGAAGLGVALTGKALRNISKGGTFGETAQQTAQVAESPAGQQYYNFGKDITKTAASVVGWSPFGQELSNTDKGIGAITSGLLNFGFEMALTPDIAAGKLTGGAIRGTIRRPIIEAKPGVTGYLLKNYADTASYRNLQEDTALIDKTVAGEQTPYTPLFNFIKNSTPAELANRTGLNREVATIASQILPGEDFPTIGLVLKAGRGNYDAVLELTSKRADIANELNRLSDALVAVEKNGTTYLTYKGKTTLLSADKKTYIDSVKSEVKALTEQKTWLDNALALDSRMQDITVSRWAWVEKVRNDLAKEQIARKMEAGDVVSSARETIPGRIMQYVYQKSPLSVPIRFIDRLVDDTPRNTINFNDTVQTPERLRTSLRQSIRYGGMLPEETVQIYNKYLSSSNEAQKLTVVRDYTTRLAANLGAKYDIHPSIISTVLDSYDKAHRTMLEEARTASIEKRSYFFGPNGIDDILSDPQLVTQLANGAYLPDAKLWDAAFKRYKEKYGEGASLPQNIALAGKFISEEFNSLWRGFTLMRTGYPLNIIRDSAVRAYGDVALWGVLKDLGEDAIYSIFNTNNSVKNVKNTLSLLNNPKKQALSLRSDITLRDNTIAALEKALKDAGYDIKKLPKDVPNDIQSIIDNIDGMRNTVAELRRQENAIISGEKFNVIGRDRTVDVYPYTFPAKFSGRKGDISRQQLMQKEDIKRALTSLKELEIQNVRRGRTGSRSLLATENENLHLVEWEQTLRDSIGFDPVARMIMEGKPRQEITSYLRGEGSAYMDRLGLRPADAGIQYSKVKQMVDWYAPTEAIRKATLDGTISVKMLQAMFPDINTRPPVLTDLVKDNLGTSNAYIKGRNLLKSAVAWLSTAPTSRLMYSPYFSVKYQQKLQEMVLIANKQNRVLTAADKDLFENTARSYAIREYREKLNSFHRDMNYGGFINYLLAFFPAIVEQYRAYGRIALEHPEFLIKAAQISTIPDRALNVQQDPFGYQYVEVDMPLYGVKGRIPASWFNVFNPTGGASIVSAGPILSFSVNEYAKKNNVENMVTRWALPFGVQANSAQILTPNTIKRAAQAFQASWKKDGEQFNKDSNMFLQQIATQFVVDNGRNPSGKELGPMIQEAQDRSVALAWLRFGGAFFFPTQPQYVSSLQWAKDELNRMRQADPIHGEEQFTLKYPEYFLMTSRMSDSTSGIHSDETSVNLVKKNSGVVTRIVAEIGKDNLNVLGAIFNDDNYAFSSSAQAWLASNNIPGTSSRFRESKAVLDSLRSSVVNKGWSDYTKLISIVTDEVEQMPGYSVDRGYGKIVLDKYKAAFIESQKQNNSIWYNEYVGGGTSSKQKDLVTSLSIAANTPELWKDLQKQTRWTTIVNYLNFRYDIYDALKARKTTIDSPRATDLRQAVDTYALKLRKEDVNFGKFYDRYFTNDRFDFVYGG